MLKSAETGTDFSLSRLNADTAGLGALETDDGALVLFTWQGCARDRGGGRRELAGSITHVTDDGRYSWLNDGRFDVVFEVAELVWEPLG